MWMISSGVILAAIVLLPALLRRHNVLVGVLNAFLPNVVNVAREGLLLEILAAKFFCNPVNLVQLLLIVPRHGDSLLVVHIHLLGKQQDGTDTSASA